MTADELRFFYDYDRWATRKVLRAAGRLRARDWPGEERVDARNLGEILVHALGAHQRWRHGLSETGGRIPRPEREPMPSVRTLAAAWEAEWETFDAWFATLDDATLAAPLDGVPMWRMLAHVVNHGTQHRSEAAVLLTRAGASPRALDMIDFAERHASDSPPRKAR